MDDNKTHTESEGYAVTCLVDQDLSATQEKTNTINKAIIKLGLEVCGFENSCRLEETTADRATKGGLFF